MNSEVFPRNEYFILLSKQLLFSKASIFILPDPFFVCTTVKPINLDLLVLYEKYDKIIVFVYFFAYVQVFVILGKKCGIFCIWSKPGQTFPKLDLLQGWEEFAPTPQDMGNGVCFGVIN